MSECVSVCVCVCVCVCVHAFYSALGLICCRVALCRQSVLFPCLQSYPQDRASMEDIKIALDEICQGNYAGKARELREKLRNSMTLRRSDGGETKTVCFLQKFFAMHRFVSEEKVGLPYLYVCSIAVIVALFVRFFGCGSLPDQYGFAACSESTLLCFWGWI